MTAFSFQNGGQICWCFGVANWAVCYISSNNHQCNFTETSSRLRLCEYRNSHLDFVSVTIHRYSRRLRWLIVKCPPPGRWIMKQWPVGVNSRFAEVTENNILRMQDIIISNDTKKATKLGMKVFRDKQCFNTQFAYFNTCPVSSLLISKLRWCLSP